MLNHPIATLGSLAFLLSFFNISVFAQCTNDAHSTQPLDSWLSCEMSVNPNSIRENSHWIQYDLGYVYQLGQATIWNYNVSNETDKGFKTINIDYSTDGQHWISAGQFQLPIASGTNDYTGYDGFDFGGVAARYILLTAQSSWGSECTGIAEFKVAVQPSTLATNWMELSVATQSDYIELVWKNDFQQPLEYFEIERSTDGTNFYGLQTVEEHGEPTYIFNDEEVQAGQLYYYRLKAIYTDDTYQLSTIQTAQLALSDADFTIYPNPTSDVLKVNFSTDLTREIIIQNAAGQEVFRKKINTTLTQIDVAWLPAGIYLCTVFNQHSAVMTKRFIKTD